MKDRHLDNLVRLQHINQAITRIQYYVKNENLNSFLENQLIQDAVLFKFSVIGEAIIHVENETLSKYDYPWYKVRSFRNLIAHEYFNIKISAVWQIIISDLSVLQQVIQVMIKDFT